MDLRPRPCYASRNHALLKFVWDVVKKPRLLAGLFLGCPTSHGLGGANPTAGYPERAKECANANRWARISQQRCRARIVFCRSRDQSIRFAKSMVLVGVLRPNRRKFQKGVTSSKPLRYFDQVTDNVTTFPLISGCCWPVTSTTVRVTPDVTC